MGAGLLEGDEREAAESEFAASAADGEPLDPAPGAGRLDQNVFDTFSQRMDLFAEIFGLPYSQFTPWGLSGGYYYARLNYGWGG